MVAISATGSISYADIVSSASYTSRGGMGVGPLGPSGPLPRTLAKNDFAATLDYQEGGAGETITIIEEITTIYYQRVYDAGTSGWCYYSGTSIDTTPESSETRPNFTGAISGHSVIRILDFY
tara:strand:- start:4262 stop:4627 length:366 start_codon:yes stop_codon:yes gene_type:complete